MKKFIFVVSALLLMSMQVVAQKYFDVYQNGKLTISIPATSVDSVGLTGTTMENRKVNFYRNDNTVNSFLVSTVDSIKIFRTGDEQLVYLGIVGFNQDLYIKPIDVLANSTAGFYTSYVSDLERRDGTLLYYAVDRALYLLSSKDFPTPLSSVNLVTFTDGLDQGSLMMNGNYYTDEQYLDAVNNRIRNTTVKGLPVTAYSLGMRGSDVSDYTKFQNNLKKLASSADKAFEVSSMSDVSTRLQEISNKIISISNRQNFSFKIPGQSNGTVIRFTFDGYSADNSKMYIEGTFNLANRSLNNVSYHGIKATSGSYIQGTQNGIFVTFTFTGMQREDGNGLIPQSNVCEYYKSAGSSTWQQNSEFSPSDNTQTTVTHSGAAIMLVLDCSNSLGSQFSNMKSYAQNFINRVANNTKEFKVEAPQNVTATLTNDLDVAISWDAVKHAEYYEIQRSNSQYGTYSTVSQWLYSTSWTDKNPLSGSNYYKVIAHGHSLESTNNTTVSVARKLEAPNNVIATLTDDLYVTISWSAVKGAEYYVVQRSSSSGTYDTVSSNMTSTSWTDMNPLSGSNYYKVYAYGHGLTSEQSSYVFVNRKLEAPNNVTATLTDNLDVTISWSAVKGAEYYVVQRSSSWIGHYSAVSSNVTSTSWTDTDLMSEKDYYRVTAYGHGLESAISSYVLVVRKLEVPNNTNATYISDTNTVMVTWDEVKGNVYYKVLRSKFQEEDYRTVADSVTSPSWMDTAPLEGLCYYKVIAYGRGVKSESSSSVSVETLNVLTHAATNIVTFIINGVELCMVKVDGGVFEMGATPEQEYIYSSEKENESPVHQVTLSDFYMGETEVTQALWEAVMGSNPSKNIGSHLPVQYVSWDDCQEFITKLNALTGKQFRLPTEAEWEYAARGGSQSQGYKYAGSNNIDDVAWYSENSYFINDETYRLRELHFVGTKAPNELGLYDMSGNVCEYCQDWYGSYSSDVQTNPAGPQSGSSRVVRGGGYDWIANGCRVSKRLKYDSTHKANYNGLRVVLKF